jgi:hypothetical protein
MLQDLAEKHDRQCANGETVEEPFPSETRAFLNEYREYLSQATTRTSMPTRRRAPLACLSPSPSLRISGAGVSGCNTDSTVADPTVSSFEAAASFVVDPDPAPARVHDKRRRVRRPSGVQWDSGFWEDESDTTDVESSDEIDVQHPPLSVRRLTGQLTGRPFLSIAGKNEPRTLSDSGFFTESPVQTPTLEKSEASEGWLSWPLSFGSTWKLSDIQETREQYNEPDSKELYGVQRRRKMTDSIECDERKTTASAAAEFVQNFVSNKNACERALEFYEY